MKAKILHEVYNIDKTCAENYEHGPFFESVFPTLPPDTKKIKLWDFELNSRLGIPSGPLLNSKFIDFYARFGFDILVYKTVRSTYRQVHPWPNCVFVDKSDQFKPTDPITDIFTTDRPASVEDITITNSFGVQAPTPEIWMADIEKANKLLQAGQLMPVSILGTPGLEERDMVEDFGYVAKMAIEAGAKMIITNYSCPNVRTGEGSVYADPELSAKISAVVRKSIGPNVPFVMKMGWLPPEKLEEVVTKNRPYVDGFSGINTVPQNVRTPDGAPALPGEGRLKSGLCGAAIREVAQDFTAHLEKIRQKNNDDFVIIGVGGMMSADHLKSRLNAGADVVMSATATMWDPYLALKFKEKY